MVFSFTLSAVPLGLWDLNFLTRDQTCVPCSGTPNHWTTREVPHDIICKGLKLCGFLCLLVGGVLESIPRGYQGTTVLILSHFWLWDVCSVTTNWRVFHGTNPSSQTMETLIFAQGFQELVSGPRVRKRPVRNSLGRGHLSPLFLNPPATPIFCHVLLILSLWRF